jgi:oxygen-independent coproporphyrinogen-3 oxidase
VPAEAREYPVASSPEPGVVRSVYVHAPFCVRRCFYCDFAVQVRKHGDPSEWLDALAGELRALEAEDRFRLAPTLDTLYVGGGTPSLLGPEAMTRLGDVLGRDRLAHAGLEWTAEANPESLTPELARAWRAAGVNRLSVGIQTFHEPALRWMGRMHGPRGAREAVRSAKEAGFENLSVDLIFGLPAHLGRAWRADLEAVLELDVSHISLYGLTVELATPLGRAVREGREQPVDEAQYEEEFLLAAEVLTGAGYRHYEVSNFARPGARSRHNSVYWEGDPYLGLGNGAHSYLHPLRRWNLREWDAYRESVTGGRLAVDSTETLDRSAERLERVWLALRTDRGWTLSGADPQEARALLDRWIEHGWARREDDHIRLLPRGWLLLDELAVELDGALTG